MLLQTAFFFIQHLFVLEKDFLINNQEVHTQLELYVTIHVYSREVMIEVLNLFFDFSLKSTINSND